MITTASILGTVAPLETRIKEQLNLFATEVGGDILPVFLETVFNSILTEYQMQLEVEEEEEEGEEDSHIEGDSGPTVGFDIMEMLGDDDRPVAADNRKVQSRAPRLCLYTHRNKRK